MRLLKFKYFLIINSRCCSVNLILFWRVTFVLSLILFAIPCDNAAEIFGGGKSGGGHLCTVRRRVWSCCWAPVRCYEWTDVIRSCVLAAVEWGALLMCSGSDFNEWTYVIMKILPGWMLRDYLLYLNETTRQLYEINLNTIILLI